MCNFISILGGNNVEVLSIQCKLKLIFNLNKLDIMAYNFVLNELKEIRK
jgi:hypothetical protein